MMYKFKVAVVTFGHHPVKLKLLLFNILGLISDLICTHVFTTFGIYVIDVILIRIVQNYSQMLWYLAVSIIAIHICLGLQILTPPNSNVFWTVWLVSMKNNLFIFILSVPRIKTNVGSRDLSFAPLLFAVQFSHLSCYLQETSQNISFWLGLPSENTSVPDRLVLRNSFIDFALEH